MLLVAVTSIFVSEVANRILYSLDIWLTILLVQLVCDQESKQVLSLTVPH